MRDMTNTSESRNVRIAKLLGWTIEWCYILGHPRADGHWMGIPPHPVADDAPYTTGRSGKRYVNIPDFVGSCDASLAAVPDDFETLITFDFDTGLYNATLRNRNINSDVWYWMRNGTTRSEALAAALEAWLVAKQEAT